MSEEEIERVGESGPAIDSIQVAEFESHAEQTKWLEDRRNSSAAPAPAETTRRNDDMRISLLNRIVRWVTARSRRAAPPDTGTPAALSPAQTKRLLIRLHDLEWQVRGLMEQCSALKETVCVHNWSLEALWEQVQEPRTPPTLTDPPDTELPKKKTPN